MVNFAFSANKKILFGREQSFALPREIKSLSRDPGKPVLLISGKSITQGKTWKKLYGTLEKEGFVLVHKIVSGEPSPDTVDAISRELKKTMPSLVVAIGGGSVLDAGKAVSAMLMEEGSVQDFLEGVGSKDASGEKIPFIAVPTTAGTGSECTKNAVISRPGPDGFKKSLRHDNYIPDLALVDPIWLEELPREWIASCGMDAFSQLLESYISTGASPLSDALALEGLKGFIQSFEPVLKGTALEEDLEAITLGASLSGLTLANAGLGTVHGIAGVLGGLGEIPHGTACGLLLPPVMRETFRRIKEQDPNHPVLQKAAVLGGFIKGNDQADKTERLIESLLKWQDMAALPGLSVLGMDSGLQDKAASQSGNKNNPYSFTEEERLRLLREVW